MPSLFPHASFKRRSPRARTRTDSISANTDIVCPPSRSSIHARRKTRPPPLQVIPELSEHEADIDVSSTRFPATRRRTQSFLQPSELKTSSVSLSTYAFSIDKAPRSPTLSAPSSTPNGGSSKDVPTIHGISDNEDGHDVMPPTPNARPQRISIRPHCTIKTQSSICQEDEDIHNDLEKEETRAAPFPVTEEQPESSAEAKEATEGPEQAEQNFYMHEFEDFISVSPATISTTSPARRDSLTIAAEALPANVDVPEPNPRGRSRHSPPATVPVFPFPSIPTLPPVQTCARKDSRPFPRVAVPLDIEDCIFPEESEIPETPLSGTDSEVVLPGSSTDSDPPRSSVDSTLSFASSGSSDTPTSPLSFPKSPSPDSELESTQRLRSRWSTSSLDSPAVEPPRTPTLLFPLRNVFGSRARRGLLPPQNVPPQMSPHLSKNKHGFPTKHLRLGTLSKRIRRQGLRSSTSSAGTSSSECDSHEGSPRGSPRGLKRKLTPVSMFLRTT